MANSSTPDPPDTPDPLHTPLTDREIEQASHGEAFDGLGDERPVQRKDPHAEMAHRTLAADVIEDEEGPRFDVLIAESLDPPFRHMQSYLWMEVAATDPPSAIRRAYGYVESSDRILEVPGLYRVSGDHPERVAGLIVDWNAPVLQGSRPGSVVRHSVTGLRLGFVATKAARERLLPQETPGYVLLTRKPSDGADVVCLAPLVHQTDPTRR